MCFRARDVAGAFGSQAAVVVAQDHVHHPVERVSGGPMSPDHRAGRMGRERRRGDGEARVAPALQRDPARAFAHDNAVQTRPVLPVPQPSDVVNDRMFGVSMRP